MFRKHNLRRQIQRSKERIEMLEKRRERSQAALVSAILSHEEPDDRDVDFFNRFSEQIEEERALLRRYIAEYEYVTEKTYKNK